MPLVATIPWPLDLPIKKCHQILGKGCECTASQKMFVSTDPIKIYDLLFKLHSVEQNVTVFEKTIENPVTDTHGRAQHNRHILEK